MEIMRKRFMENMNLYKLGKTNPGATSSNSKDTIPYEATSEQKGYGPIPGIEPGTIFADRRACYEAGVHAVTFAGIHGSQITGAYSVCLSGGYEDDKDDGEFFVYTGTGGQGDSFGGDNRQVGDQTLLHQQNASLMMSAENKRPVRVVRGSHLNSKWAPAEGFRYDGIYHVEKGYSEKGISGHLVWKFHFRREPGQPPIPSRLP